MFNHYLSYHSYFNPPDLGFFLFDIGSDIYNGINYIDEGNLIWGVIILGVIFLPMTVLYVGYVIAIYRHKDTSQSKKLLILLFTPIYAALHIPIATVLYIGYVAYVFARKCIQPDYEGNTAENNVSWVGMFKLVEAVAEANVQAVLGWYTSFPKVEKN